MAFTTGAAILEDEAATLTTVVSSGASLVTDAVGTGTQTTLSSLAAFTSLFITFQSAVTTVSGASIPVYRRDLNGGGSFDVEAPSTDNKQVYVGSFIVPVGVSINTDVKLKLSAVPIDGDCTFYIGNLIEQSINSGWTLQSDAKTYNAAA